jgi:hypothetical protein
MTRLTFDTSPVTYDEENVTTKQLFVAVVALMQRMERLESLFGMLTNLVLTITTEDGEPPSQEEYDTTVQILDEFLGDLKEELDAHRKVRQQIEFLHTPE